MADGRNRKCGNNKEACKLYFSRGRLERNKKRNKARALRMEEKHAARIARRLKLGLPVPSRHKTRNSNGSWRNLGATNTGGNWVYEVNGLFREWLTPIRD